MRGLQFQNPMWLFLLVPVLVLGWLAIRRQRQTAILFSDVGLLRSLPKTMALRMKQWIPWLRILGFALIIIALARPQKGKEEFRIRTEGIAIQMCIDQSGSMQAMDFQLDGERVNRLDAVKDVFRDFVAGKGDLPGRPDDLIGLIAFGGYPDAKCPLTLDHGALLQVLNQVEIPQPILDHQGRIINMQLLQEEMNTAIGDAVVLGVDRLKDVPAKSRVLILLSDGENTAGVVEPDQAAEMAKTFGIKIYTIGVGSTGMAPFPEIDVFGRKYLTQRPVRLDEKTLTMLATATGGKYFHARNTEALNHVYREIDQLEKTPSEGRLYTEYREWYQYAMFPGLSLILLEIVCVCTRFRSLP
ncbi:MAG: VWA domain-containing protein [Pirellulales bacterium]|nr:VWA domain-containing protein [Pirellulales bacterium]